MTESSVPDISQIQADYEEWPVLCKALRKKKWINGLVFGLAVPVLFVLAVIGLSRLVISLNEGPGLFIAMLLGVILSISIGVRRVKKIGRESDPLKERLLGYQAGLHARLLSEIFGTRVKVSPETVRNPDFFDSGMADHFNQVRSRRNWNYELDCCTFFSRGSSEISLCGVYADDSDKDPDQHVIRTYRGIYMAVHTRRRLSFSHDPLYIARQNADPVPTDPFRKNYSGKRKVGTLGSRTEVDSVDEIPPDLARAILNVDIPQYGFYVAECWITADGSFYFRIGGPRPGDILPSYDRTEQIFRAVYPKLRDLADACTKI